MRLALEEKGAGSLLNRLASQDQQLELLRFQQFGYSSLQRGPGGTRVRYI